MDYTTVKVEDEAPCCQACWVESDINLGWDCGEISEILITVHGKLCVGNATITPEKFLRGSSTKCIHFVLQNFAGEVVNEQRVYADNLEYRDGLVFAYYTIDSELTQVIRAGSYHLLVYLENKLPAVKDKLPERNILNMLLTDPDGIEITVT